LPRTRSYGLNLTVKL